MRAPARNLDVVLVWRLDRWGGQLGSASILALSLTRNDSVTTDLTS